MVSVVKIVNENITEILNPVSYSSFSKEKYPPRLKARYNSSSQLFKLSFFSCYFGALFGSFWLFVDNFLAIFWGFFCYSSVHINESKVIYWNIFVDFLGKYGIWATDKPNTNFWILITRAFTLAYQIFTPTNSIAKIW